MQNGNSESFQVTLVGKTGSEIFRGFFIEARSLHKREAQLLLLNLSISFFCIGTGVYLFDNIYKERIFCIFVCDLNEMPMPF
jgi:hypothetical protein